MASRAPGERPLHALILAAGQGKRMRSGRIKLLHKVGGAPLVCHVARAAAALRPASLAAVVGNQGDEVAAALAAYAPQLVRQETRLGTAHAVLQAEPLLKGRRGDLLILNGDVPLIRPSTLRALVRRHRSTGSAATVLTTRVDDPAGYGRIVRGADGSFEAIVEDRDATTSQKAISEINAGLYCADLSRLWGALRKTGRSNRQGEYYLPDLFPLLRKAGHRVETLVYEDAPEVLGVNDRAELAQAGKALYRRQAEALMEAGVTILDPDCTYIEPDVTVGCDTIIHPLARLEGRTRVGEGCVIGALCHLVDTTLADGVTLLDMCVLTESTVGPGAKIGPFSHLRPGSVLEAGVHIGNFVETKKSRLGKGSKANHLSYLGDAQIGEGCNIGAGTITCNYDGYAKHTTVLEDEVFIGSDTQLVAPVTIRKGAYVGAGSTITKEVPEYSLALTRAELRILKDWVRRRQAERAAASAQAAPVAAARKSRG
ncbi:MAG: bifunctional UDP-N-acetylglucosamine diphosphorylase/glucosamine-1-phosphate N-acetyltransferase GlmU [Candidatus Polarisedimenticolia bacterium]